MGKDFKFNRQFPDAKLLKLPFELGMRNTSIPRAIPCTVAVPTNSSLPAFGYGQLKEPHSWLHGSPCLRPDLTPETMLHKKILPTINFFGTVPAAVNENSREVHTRNVGGQCPPKQFLVFDQTGDKMTMIFSSGVGNPLQRLSSWSLRDGLGTERDDGRHYSGPNLIDIFDEDHDTNDGSVRHEDTDEIDALLYSDNKEQDTDDGEETSTGHSPSTMTVHEKNDWSEEEAAEQDEVASSAPPVKRQKLSEGAYGGPALTDTASSVKPDSNTASLDDAESSCAGKLTRCYANGSSSGNKRLRKDKIRETVNLLQAIIPGGKGKNAVMVLDEAINYLRTLKLKAKSVGLSSGCVTSPHCPETVLDFGASDLKDF